MPVPIGTKLGTYEVTSHIGSGGMGEVYQAHDTKLGRDVAIKVLPEKFARDFERLARFQREAKLLAALNHPNVATIHGLEQSGDTHYLVMELVPGDTLRDRILRDGALPVEEALKIAKQIAEALEAAHNSEKAIIHRDLKPANVKVTPEGRVKVLDFGLAKAFTAEPSGEDVANSPTLSMNATAKGVIMGTAAYMSPEQAKGKPVNKSTDIFAFGSVLYEMLTGKQAFTGEDVGDILAAVVMKDPDWSKLPPDTPPSIKTLLRRCLRKDRQQRLQDAATLRIEIEEALAAPTAWASTPAAATPSAQPRWFNRQLLVLGSVALLLGLLVAGFAAWQLKPLPPRPVTRAVLTIPLGDQLVLQDAALALSPDGTQLAYAAIRNGVRQIYIRPLDGLEARPLPGTENATNPFFSPDGQWIGFATTTKLAKISVNGGAAVTLASVTNLRGAAWSDKGTIVFSPNNGSPLQQVSDSGGVPVSFTIEKGESGHRTPEFLPKGNALLFATIGTNPQLVVQSLANGERQNLVPGGASPKYFPSGHLLYYEAGSLMAAPFDPKRLQLTGPAVPVVEGVSQGQISNAGQYAVSRTGSLVYIPGVARAEQELVWVTRAGVEQPLSAPRRAYAIPRISPDGRRIAVVLAGQPGGQIWLYDPSREALTRFTFEGTTNAWPVWAPDGKRIVFTSNKDNISSLQSQLADGSGGLEHLITSEYQSSPMSWSGDGQSLAFLDLRPNAARDIYVLRLSDRKIVPFTQTPFTEGGAAFSPDGRWLVYSSDESGRTEVYVQPYPGPGGKWQVSTDGGNEPAWHANGREIFYRNGDKMMSVDVSTQPAFSMGKPKLLFTAHYVPTFATIRNYDVAPDGQHFLMVKPVEGASQIIDVILNFDEELKRRVPTGTK